MKPALVISLGGSVLAPNGVDIRFLRRFKLFVRRQARTRRVVVVCGGGRVTRQYVAAARASGVRNPTGLHWIGVRATQLNAEVLRAVLGVQTPVLTSYTKRSRFTGRVIVAAGRKPGATTDLGSVVLARALGASTVYNVTNVAGVFTADPHRVRNSRMIPALSWKRYRSMFGGPATPSMHAPFDPVAARAADRSRLRVFVLSSSISNLERAIAGTPFIGTVIGPGRLA